MGNRVMINWQQTNKTVFFLGLVQSRFVIARGRRTNFFSNARACYSLDLRFVFSFYSNFFFEKLSLYNKRKSCWACNPHKNSLGRRSNNLVIFLEWRAVLYREMSCCCSSVEERNRHKNETKRWMARWMVPSFDSTFHAHTTTRWPGPIHQSSSTQNKI